MHICRFLSLSIWQPWAHLLVHGPKNVENREVPAAVRGWVIVHASCRLISRADWSAASLVALRRGVDLAPHGCLDRGAFVGAVRIDESVTQCDSPWFEGPHGYVIGDRVAFRLAIKGLGERGFFPVPGEGQGTGGDAIAAAIAEELAAAGKLAAVLQNNPATPR